MLLFFFFCFTFLKTCFNCTAPFPRPDKVDVNMMGVWQDMGPARDYDLVFAVLPNENTSRAKISVTRAVQFRSMYMT